MFTYIILVILTARERNLDKFKSGGLHEKHAVATWNLGTISAFAYKTEDNQEKPVSRWPVAGPSGYTLTSSQRSGK
jgi:hypothetical protein